MEMKGRDGSDLKVIETIAAGSYESFGMRLLHDKNSVTVDLLKKNHIHEGAESITKAIIKEWVTVASPTAPCTYQHLIECLRRSHRLGALADSIAAVVGGNIQYSHFSLITCTCISYIHVFTKTLDTMV